MASVLKKAYGSDRIMPDQEAIDVWYGFLKDIDYPVMRNAVSQYVSSSKFPPAISELRDTAMKLVTGQAQPWDEAWGQVLMAIRKFGYMREQEALDSLPEMIRRIVARFGFQNLCQSENISVDRANFRDVYKAEVQRRHGAGILPAAIRSEAETLLEQYVRTAANTLTLEKKEDI